MRDQRDTPVAGDDQPQPDQAQVVAFLLRLAPRRDRRPLVARVDERGEVRHVQHQPGQVQPEPGHHRPTQFGLDPPQIGPPQRVHRVPEPAMIQPRLGGTGMSWTRLLSERSWYFSFCAMASQPMRPTRTPPTTACAPPPVTRAPSGVRPCSPTNPKTPTSNTDPRSGSPWPGPDTCPPTRPRPPAGAPPRRSPRPRPGLPASTTPRPDPRTYDAANAPAGPPRHPTASRPPQRCYPSTAATRSAACHRPSRTPPGSSRSAHPGVSPRSTAHSRYYTTTG